MTPFTWFGFCLATVLGIGLGFAVIGGILLLMHGWLRNTKDE